MQILEIDWDQFIGQLPPFQILPQEARRVYLERVGPTQPVRNAELGEHCEALTSSGFLLSGPKGKNAVVPPHYRAFCRVMRSLYRHRIFDSPSPETFEKYFSGHFTGSERSSLCRLAGDYYYGWGNPYPQVSSIEWLNRFLEATVKKWKQPSPNAWVQCNLSAESVLRATQELVRSLMTRPSPIPLTELRGLCPKVKPDLLSASLRAGILELVFFPALCGDDLVPSLGIWPRITARLFRAAPEAPAPVKPHQVFHAPLLMDDMAVILAACAVEPFRLRKSDHEIFERTARELAPSLGSLPEWVEHEFQVTMAGRITRAIAFSRRHGFLEQKWEDGDPRQEITETGRRWLGCPAKERLKTLMDDLRGGLANKPGPFYWEAGTTSMLPDANLAYDKHSVEIQRAVLGCYAEYGVDQFVRLREFLAYHCQQGNPLIALARASRHSSIYIRGTYVTVSNQDEVEEAWSGVLSDFLNRRLLPLGGAKAGWDADGGVCFALTEAGQYLAGARTGFDFEPPSTSARIVVQPNFDVVFLAAAPQVESEISRFAARKGRHVGTLFKITKRTILAAAAAGLTEDHVGETLRQCAGEVPSNVQREISGWFDQCRQITVRPAVLIHCPDASTGARVLATAGAIATPITDTTIEIRGKTVQASLLRKLRDNGIFVRPARSE